MRPTAYEIIGRFFMLVAEQHSADDIVHEIFQLCKRHYGDK